MEFIPERRKSPTLLGEGDLQVMHAAADRVADQVGDLFWKCEFNGFRGLPGLFRCNRGVLTSRKEEKRRSRKYQPRLGIRTEH